MGAPAMNILDPVRAGMRNTPPGTVAGIRPEYVEVVADGVPLAVELVEPLGAETLIHGTLRCGQRLTLKRAGPPPSADGLNVRFPQEALHFFDAASGVRIEEVAAF
jgi:sn-glycerol 3-phosphate transport system ATP-binding protein